jgi:hypothetical protein
MAGMGRKRTSPSDDLRFSDEAKFPQIEATSTPHIFCALGREEYEANTPFCPRLEWFVPKL